MKMRYSGIALPGFTAMNTETHFSLYTFPQMPLFSGPSSNSQNLCVKNKLGLVTRSQISSVNQRKPYSNQNESGGNSRATYKNRKQVAKSPPSGYGRLSLLEMRNNTVANRPVVYEFLRSIGIVPNELDGLELPVTIEVMKERVDFLYKLGLTIDDINNYPLVLGCSVKKNMIPVLDYLGKLGLRKLALTDFLRRYPQALHASVVVDLEPVVKYLKGMDIKPQDIPRVLERYPEVLGFKLEGTMSTSVAYLVGIGVSRREIGRVLTRYPEILGMRVARMIKPFVDYLVTLGLPRLAVARLIEKRPHILGFGLADKVKPNISLLLENNVRSESLASVVAQYPEIIGLDLPNKLKALQSLLQSAIDLDFDKFGGVVEKMPQIVSVSNGVIEKHVEFLKKCGFTVAQVRVMVEGCPQVLALNLDIMQLCFDFFMEEMDRPLDDLAAFPAFFTYSLESTIKPRHRRVAHKGFKCSLSWFLNCSDQKFEDRMEYDTIDMEEMEMPAFDMNTFMGKRSDDSDSDYDDSEDE